jgi:hypothetical protein
LCKNHYIIPDPIEIKYRSALKDEELKHATFASSFYGTLVSSFVTFNALDRLARNIDSRSSFPKIFIAQKVPMNASPAPTVFTFFKPLSTRSIVGIEITSLFFPKNTAFLPSSHY